MRSRLDFRVNAAVRPDSLGKLMDRRKFNWLALCLILFAVSAQAAPIQPPYDLYSTQVLSSEGARRFETSSQDWKILHRETTAAGTWFLLALPDGGRREAAGSESVPGYLGRVRVGERVVLLAPNERSKVRGEPGRSLQVAPSGATVFVTSTSPERLAARAHHSFQVLERTQERPPVQSGEARRKFQRLLDRTLEAGNLGTGTRSAAEVELVRNAVKADSLEVIVRSLSELPSQQKRSRYFARPETKSVSRIYIASKLEAALGAGNVSSHIFTVTTADTSATVTNVIGHLRCGLPDAGAILLTAHYDAIGTRSDPVQLCAEGHRPEGSGCDCSLPESVVRDTEACEWDWRKDPAPGADDNATGIACILEAARVLNGLPFQFDVIFVAFQGEELGLLGSAAFADSIAEAGQEIIAVFNVDMIGYAATRSEADLVTNATSTWFADYIEQTAGLFVPDLAINNQISTFGRSDHASFWAVGIDAVDLTEDTDITYPQYHTFQDTWESTFVRPAGERQFLLGCQLMVSTLARLAVHYDAPDLAIPSGELEVGAQFGSTPRAGLPLRLTAHIHNLGSSSLTFAETTIDTLNARVTFYDGDPTAGGVMIAEVTRRGIFRAGGVEEMTALWTPPLGSEGYHEIFSLVEGLDFGYELEEISNANNQTSQRVFLLAPAGQGAKMLTQYVYPNPVRGDRTAIQFYYELTQDAQVDITVFDLAGIEVGRFRASSEFIAEGNQSGENRVSGAGFNWGSEEELESGVYFYTIRVSNLSGVPTDQSKGKFALVR